MRIGLGLANVLPTAPSGEVAAPADPHTIVSITDDGDGNAVWTMAAPFDFSMLGTIVASGCGNAGYNGAHSVDVPGDGSFIEFGGYIGDSSGGTWAEP